VHRSDADAHEALVAPDAGDRAIRGGAMRVSGYVIGLLLTAAASVLLLRYLGVDDFGRYIVVVSVLAIVGGLADAGTTVIGQREYVTGVPLAERREFLASLLGLRLAITPVVAAAAVAFVAVAGYSSAQVAGTAIAGAGFVLAIAAATFTIPLTAELRLGAVTVVEIVRQAALVAAIVAFVVVAADLVTIFFAYIASGAAALVAAIVLVDRAALVAPRWHRERWVRIARLSAPIALGLVVNVLYLRLLVILVSLLSDARETGLFGTSYRVLEIFIGIPQLMAGAAFPILAHAAVNDPARFAYVIQRLAEASLLVALALVLALALGAETVIEILGGAEYRDAAPVLTVQSVALVGAFLTQVWVLGLIALERQSALAVINGVGLVVVAVLGLALIPAADAMGAAVAAVVGEAALAITALVLLVRARPGLRPRAGIAARLLLAAAIAAGCALLPGPDIVRATLAVLVYGALVLLLGAHPVELLHAFDPRRRSVA
jgi:O-antigen/teichoic acid export membrane protein